MKIEVTVPETKISYDVKVETFMSDGWNPKDGGTLAEFVQQEDGSVLHKKAEQGTPQPWITVYFLADGQEPKIASWPAVEVEAPNGKELYEVAIQKARAELGI